MKTTPKTADLFFLDGGGDMGDFIKTRDWEKTVLGSIASWPAGLCTTLGIILHSNIPMFLFWGEEFTCFYNDAFMCFRGGTGQHEALGKNGKEIGPELWDVVGGSVKEIFHSARPISLDARPVAYGRDKKFPVISSLYNCSPVFDDKGKVTGVLVICKAVGNEMLKQDEDGNIETWPGTGIPDQEQVMEVEKQVRERTKELVALNAKLRESEQRYHLMVEEVQDYAILYINREGVVQNWNRGAEKIKGYKAKEIIGKNFNTFYTEEDRKNGLPHKLLNFAIANNRAGQEGWRVRKDKSLFWASVVITAVHDENNEVIGFSKVTHDLTEKKRSDDALKNKTIELEQKNVELQKMNKELQSFAYISSHDLQEPLRKIQTFASRIAEKEKENLSENGQYLFNRMQLSAERMQMLIDDLLAYSRTNNLGGDFQSTDLNELIDQVKEDLCEELKKGNLTVESHNIGNISIIPYQIKQVFYNLLSNSFKFSHPERPLQIRIVNELVKGKDRKNANLEANKAYCHIAYSDNGIGFDQKYSEKIFELFQRLHGKSEYAGTGIGLAIIKRIVENHDGAVTARGRLGKGATFDIYIPAKK